jgi:ubiquinone/menaquinone biosynthesis C-methylase UbiE
MSKLTYYDQIAQGYEELHYEEQVAKIKLISKFLTTKKDDKLLDVGCGTGVTTELWNCKRYGLDPAKKLLEKARNKENVEYKLGIAENIPYPDNFFDIVISVTAIQNFSDIKKGLLEIKRVGKNIFVLSILKNSPRIEFISKIIHEIFDVSYIIKQQHDLIFFVGIEIDQSFIDSS